MTKKQKAAFGSWESNITTDLMLADSVGLGEISVFNEDVYWIKMRPQEKGRYVIVKQTPDGQQSDTISYEFNARTRVHEYGGGSYLMTETAWSLRILVIKLCILSMQIMIIEN